MAGHVAVIPSPGMGHIIPLLELAKRLAGDHGCHVSFLNITAESSAVQKELLRSRNLPQTLHVIDLPHADVSALVSAVPESHIVTRVSIIAEENLRCLKSVLERLGNVRAVIIDIFCTTAFETCAELSIPVYSFFTASTTLFTLSLYLPILDRDVDCELVDLPEPVRVPGCPPIRTENLIDQVKNRKVTEYEWYLHHVSRLTKAAGIFLNTWQDLEPTTIRAVREDPFYSHAIKTPPVYPVGPLVKETEPVSESGRECLAWLDQQPENSVVFVALGSGGVLSSEQLAEMAWGLEMSQQRFVWVVRPPADVASGSFFDVGGNTAEAASFLPKGFLERTKGVGLVVPSWAPQMAVLGHAATGAFWSHCGWNSTLESISRGVPMIAWPLYAEQRMNAAMLSEDAGVAVWPWPWAWAGLGPTTGRRVVGRGEIERVVRMVMEGEEGKALRQKTVELKESATRALSDGGGSSYESLASVVKDWSQ